MTGSQGLHSMSKKKFTFYEFFAGGGMARLGFGSKWRCLFSNDFDPKKVAAYKANWGDEDIFECDIARLTSADLPGNADVAWASFPCQDLSLAGNKAGLKGKRSGTFWPFMDLMRDLLEEGRQPSMIVLENVFGALTSHQGKDFAAIADALASTGYRMGVQVIDASHFLPQSRVRLFVIAVREDLHVPEELITEHPEESPWYPDAVFRAYNGLNDVTEKRWVWWNLPLPNLPTVHLEELIDEQPIGVEWHTPAETKRLLSLMSDVNLAKVEAAMNSGERKVGTVYRRTREGFQRAEVRFDGVAGCLRTPGGGSSRQTIIVVNGQSIRTRLISPREAARLMGLPEDYVLPPRYNDAYHLLGDGLAVPAVSHLVKYLIEPLFRASARSQAA